MPAAAVIPAPIAYIKVVAVKKLVVYFLRVSIFVLPAIYWLLSDRELCSAFTGRRSKSDTLLRKN